MAIVPQADQKLKVQYQLADGYGGSLHRWLDLPDSVCHLMDRATVPFMHEWVWAKGVTRYEYDPVALTQRNPDSGKVRNIRKVFL